MNQALPHADIRCHLGHHHYVPKMDDNPEVRSQLHLECVRCGKRDPNYGPMSGPAMSWGILK